MKRHLYTILLPVAAALALSGCTTGSEEADEHYIKLSDAVPLPKTGGEAQDSRSEGQSGVEFRERRIVAESLRRRGKYAGGLRRPQCRRGAQCGNHVAGRRGDRASIRVYQLGARGLSARYRLLEQLNSAVMSPSGRYVGGFYTDVLGENGFQYTAVVVDLETDKWHEFGPYPETLFGFTEAEVVAKNRAYCISPIRPTGAVSRSTSTVPIRFPSGFRDSDRW